MGKVFGTVMAGAAAVQAMKTAFGGGQGAVGFSYGDPSYNLGVTVAPYGSVADFGFNGFGGNCGLGSIDLSNTGFLIGQRCGDAKRKARELDCMIQQLLEAICQGNTDMIESALTIINLKAKTTLVGAAKSMVEAMKYYDAQTKKVSDRIAGLSNEYNLNNEVQRTAYSGTLAGLNSDMNMYSMNRQAITNSVRDIMSMVEEMSNLENSVYSKKDRDSQLYRWA